MMKKMNVIVEQGEDGYFAFVEEIEGCTAGALTFAEIKRNIKKIIKITLEEDKALMSKYSKGYDIIFKLSLESLFKQLPELKIDVLAKQTGLKLTVLKSIVEGDRLATEEEAESINQAIKALAWRLQSVRLTS